MSIQTTVVSPDTFKRGMANFAGAVNIVTGVNDGGRFGFTATAVCSVSDSPATLLVCLNRSASVYDSFAKTDYLAVNTLTKDQEELSNVFGGKVPMQERFTHGEWEILESGSPIISNSAVSFDCRISHRQSIATHEVMFCEVIGIKQHGDTGALLYYQRAYHHL